MIRIGTSGYHFADWAGPFYPSDLPKDQWLDYYATQFKILEINTTYYGVPKRSSVVRWAEQTPADFRFIVKVHGDTTHKRETGGEEIPALLASLEPLRAESKLAGLLAQFPASFRANASAKQYIHLIHSHTGEIPLFVEFRHLEWDTDDAVAFCQDEGLGWVTVDLPPIRSLMGARPAVTSSTGYVRFHGKNAKTWYHPELGDRYDWTYSEEELRNWLPRLRALVDRAEETYLFFNNCHAGQAIKSAALMREILRQEQLEVG
ncbi:MAG: DUF72 domain-containing protein [bacterium]